MINHTPHTLGQAWRKHGRSRPRWFPSLCGAAALSLLWTGATAAAPDSLVATVQTSHYNGYQVSCFGMKDGWITVNATGGVPPYAYRWSNGAGTATITDLPAGYYRVAVIDQDGQVVTVEATLEQPLPMKLDVDVYEYANGYNTSCYNCSNGNASVVVVGGAAPFTINWSDGPTGAIRYNLGPKDYKIAVTDANNCGSASTTIYLRGPARNDWSMTGNAGTQPGPHFIGTTDNKDLVLKSNGQEGLRLKGNGDIVLKGSLSGSGMLMRKSNGTLGVLGLEPITPGPCALDWFPFWQITGNVFPELCPEVNQASPRLGTLNALPLDLITDNQQRLRITTDGRVGIGTTQPIGQFEVHHADERGGITLVNTLADNAHSEVRFTAADGQRWGLGCDFAADGGQDFFLWDEQATAGACW